MPGIEWIAPTAAVGVTASVFGFFVRRLINGMGKEIENKVDKVLWEKQNEMVSKEICQVGKSITSLHNDFQAFTKEVREFMLDNRPGWDGGERRRLK